MSDEQDYIEFDDCKLIRQTEKAGLFEIPDHGLVWIPWSQVSDDSISKNGEVGTCWFTQWICDKKEISY